MTQVKSMYRIVVITSLLLTVIPATASAPVPPLQAPVTDLADLVEERTEARLNTALRALRDSGGSQVAVLTVPTLDGEPIESWSMKVVEAWKLGTAKDDRGVLFLIARDDRRMRIEVGQGNEGDLTDVQSKRILDRIVAAEFKAGNWDRGIVLGTAAIVAITDPNFDFASRLQMPAARKRSSGRQASTAEVVIFLIALFVMMIFGRGGPRGRRRAAVLGGLGGYGAGGWGGSRGGFGGGFGGGGGGFSGGGASSGW